MPSSVRCTGRRRRRRRRRRRIINYFSDVVPTHGPLIDNCLAPASDAAAAAATGAASTSARSKTAAKARVAKAKAAKKKAASSEGGWFSRRRLDAPGKGRWSSNPTLAIGGITTAADVGRLLGLLANGGLAACCDSAAAAATTAAIAAATSAVTGGARRRLHGAHGGGGSRMRAGGASAETQPPPPPRQDASLDGSGRCVCGARVVSHDAVVSMLTRQFTPELESHPLVLGFNQTVGLNAALLEHMGILAPEARAVWSGQLWGDWGYGYGVWLR